MLTEPDAWSDQTCPPHRLRAVRPAGRPLAAGTPAALVMAIAAGVGLVVSLAGLAIQVLPRQFSAGQQQQIVTWEVSKRWRTLPAGDIFASPVRYALPASTLADLTGVDLQAARAGIAPQSSCAAGTDPAAARALDARGCQALLRATYTDESGTYVLTVGVAVLPGAAQAAAAQAAMTAGGGGYLLPGVRPVPFAGTPAGSFGEAQRQIARSFQAGPYLIMYTAGYADGRPRVAIGEDAYAASEMSSAALGVAQAVAATLAAPPAAPSCPGAPGC